MASNSFILLPKQDKTGEFFLQCLQAQNLQEFSQLLLECPVSEPLQR